MNLFKKKKSNKPKTRRLHIYGRYTVMSFLILLLSGLCVVFLLNTTVFHADEWNAKGDSLLAGRREIPPLRGEILASDGSILATNLNYYNIRIDFHASRINELKYIESIDSLADTLAVYYPQRTRQGWYDHLMKPMKIAKKDRSRCYLLLRAIPYDEVERLKDFPYFRRSSNSNRTGLTTERVLLRRYPYGDMAKLSIGRVGQTDKDSHIRGRSGLEAALDSLLYGKPGVASKRLFTSGAKYWTDTAAVNGITVTTTIDITMQDLLEHELGQMLVNCKGEWGSAMIMEVATGDIKAISNLDRDTVNGGGSYIEAMNHIVQAYEPGSVIKPISMLTALEDGYANVNQVYSIGKTYAYAGGKPISDTHSPAALPVGRFIEYSSNIGMTKLMAPRYENNLNGFRERLREIGFFDRFNTGMSRERTPYYPTLDPKSGGRVSLSRMFYGYATMVPPLYTCAMYNAIANDGRFVRPRLVKAMSLPDGRDSIIPISYVRDSICSRHNAALLRHMMHEVVWGEGGTAKGLRNDIVEIAGKTGTAKIAMEAPRDAKGRRITSSTPFKGGYRDGNRVTFCGFFPYDNPKYTCIVVISNPQGPIGAATTGGIVLRNVALKMYSRGMLDNHSDYMAEATDNKPSKPTLYGTYSNARSANLHRALDLPAAQVIQPTATGSGNTTTVPDVRGLGIREALVELEKCGFPVNFSGTGYVTESYPPQGATVAPGTRVTVILSQN